ncbi:hypothetical protein [Streptomyces cylindrosporus]|uniref:Uncharacterized protein n=1 Tax=Streptomyces cylindrosporus TaxID=2927583 RepID=A0ABS9YG72_9ACTN|nr:hypothetical protein [Streptomyces cylindrosporus]MCI3276238.1 hypothetical protein [Streptomyces cylindrosporus]
MVLSRLQGEDDIGVLQAVDELYAHDLLSRTCQVRYEEDDHSPDFRLYRRSDYIAGVELLTLFMEKEFSSEISRNDALVRGIDSRVRPDKWYVLPEINDWKRQPSLKNLTRWLREEIGNLADPAPGLAQSDYPCVIYSTPEVEIEFTFVPRRRVTSPTEREPIVVAGPIVTKFVASDRRLRSAVSQKAGSRYEHREKPFAIMISVRDTLCDTEDVINALYGDDAIAISLTNPGVATPVRRRNGVFSISAAHPEGRNRRLSCVFVLMRGWLPVTQEVPALLRFDNPWAEFPFPDDVLVPAKHLVARTHQSGTHMEWAPE